MAKKEKQPKATEECAAEVENTQTQEAPEQPQKEPQTESQTEQLQEALEKEHDAYLRLAAEFDNFRKRSQKEKDNIYQDAKAETIGKLLPVFDNLERATEQPTEDEAYKKGVEMTMNGMREVMKELGVREFGEAGEPFDPNMHNAVMHVEDENLGENVIAQVFQKGFAVGDKVIRFAMVQVAN